jgi:predicted RNase H-like HicB family nuclease
MADREYRVLVHEEDGAYWAQVDDLPGCFASGHDLEQLREAVIEAITLYLAGDRPAGSPATSATAHVDEMRVLVST